MPRFCELAEKEIPNFAGIQYVHTDLDEGIASLKQNRTIIWGMDTILLGALVHGFEAFALPFLNIVPETIVEVYEYVRNNKLNDAMSAQQKLNLGINDICKRGGDWTFLLKKEFNKIVRDFKVGLTRKPNLNVINRQH